jgi:hypothetical protein
MRLRKPMNGVNKHGLKRSDLTSEQKRTLRQEAGFGCVRCGNAIGTYEHIDPPFSEAKSHEVVNMAFLCMGCHDKVTRGLLSKQTVKDCKDNPRSLQDGFSFEAFDIGCESPVIHFGPLSAIDCTYLIRVNDRPVFWINEPEDAGGPFRINAELRDIDGNVIFSIRDNQWQTRNDSWDVEVVGRRITIRNGPGIIALILKSDPPHSLFVERMDMIVEGCRFYCDGSEFSIYDPRCSSVRLTKMTAKCWESAVDIGAHGVAIGRGPRPGNDLKMEFEMG